MALEVIGTLVGLVYLWLEYRASIYLWIASIIMPAFYLFVYYDAGLYADCGINVYYLGAALYGWAVWKYGATVHRLTQHIRHPRVTYTFARLEVFDFRSFVMEGIL